MSSYFRKTEISLEAVVATLTKLMFMELSNSIEHSRQAGTLNTEELSKIVKNHTKMNARFGLDKNSIPNAYVIPPKIDKNSPMINEYRRIFASNTDGQTAIDYGKGSAVGWVDLEKGQVGGVFSKIAFDVWVTNGAFTKFGEIELTPGELAAMLIHELGHIIIYFETLGSTFRTAYVLQTFTREAMKVNESSQRVVLMREFEKSTGVTITHKEPISRSNSGEGIATLVLSDIIEETRSQYGTTLYDMRSWEHLADQYAARQGAAVDLSTALNKLYAYYEPVYTRGTFVYLMMEILKTIGTILAIAISGATFSIVPLVLIFLALATSPHEREYDNPHERVSKLRRELVAQLKTEKRTDNRRDDLLADIKVLDEVLENMKDRHTFFEKFWLIISPYTRRQVKAGKEIQELEELVNNDLFVSAAKFRTLG